ncbi:unnamed protein product [Ectocarpus sp. 12 AP-2014]
MAALRRLRSRRPTPRNPSSSRPITILSSSKTYCSHTGVCHGVRPCCGSAHRRSTYSYTHPASGHQIAHPEADDLAPSREDTVPSSATSGSISPFRPPTPPPRHNSWTLAGDEENCYILW